MLKPSDKVYYNQKIKGTGFSWVEVGTVYDVNEDSGTVLFIDPKGVRQWRYATSVIRLPRDIEEIKSVTS